jgi:hypothetical protein
VRRTRPSWLRFVLAFLGLAPAFGTALTLLFLIVAFPGDPSAPSLLDVVRLPFALWLFGVLIGGAPALVTLLVARSRWRLDRDPIRYVAECGAAGLVATGVLFGLLWMTIQWERPGDGLGLLSLLCAIGGASGMVGALCTLPSPRP